MPANFVSRANNRLHTDYVCFGIGINCKNATTADNSVRKRPNCPRRGIMDIMAMVTVLSWPNSIPHTCLQELFKLVLMALPFQTHSGPWWIWDDGAFRWLFSAGAKGEAGQFAFHTWDTLLCASGSEKKNSDPKILLKATAVELVSCDWRIDQIHQDLFFIKSDPVCIVKSFLVKVKKSYPILS